MFRPLLSLLSFLVASLSSPCFAQSDTTESLHNMTLDDVLIQHSPFVFIMITSVGIIGLLLWVLKVRNRQLTESKDHLARILNEQDAVIAAIPELMFEMDLSGTYCNVWARNERELKTSQALLIGKNVFDVLPESEALKFVAALQDADEMGQSHGIQVQKSTQGEGEWLELSISLKDPDEDTHKFIVLSRDITESKRNQQQLISSQDRYQGLFENMADGVAILKAVDEAENFVIVDYNRAGERIDWVLKKDLLGKKVTESFPHVLKMGLFSVFQQVWKTGLAQTYSADYETADGFKNWRDYFIYKLKSGELVTIFSDQTATMLVEQSRKESENQKKLILQALPNLIWLKDADGVYLACNPVFERFFGAEESEIVGKTDYDFLEKSIADSFRQHDLEAMHGDRSMVNEEWITFADNGKKVLLETTKTPLKNWDGKLIGVLGVGHDITERHQAIEAKNLSASVFSYSHEGILITDADNNILDANPACLELTGYTREELIGQNPNIFSSGGLPRSFYEKMWVDLNENGHWQGEIENRKKNGEVYMERLIIDEVLDEHNELTHYVGVFSDITYLKQQEEALERVAYSDALTKLPNRLLLHDRMQQAFSQSERTSQMVSICYLDLDGFKPINDQYGHEAGDQVLIEVASRLKNSVRTGDTVARLGGDEFVLLIVNLHNIAELEQMLDRLLKSIVKPHQVSGNEMVVSASIGIALYPLDEADPDLLLRHADQAMYTAKNQGKNRYSFFDVSVERLANLTHHLQEDISRAMTEDEFFLLYQPKVNMNSGETVGAEALIRWAHPDKGIVGPMDFLPAIENNALIVDLGNWVLKTALTQMRKWRASGCDIKVSVNIAALQLQRKDFVSSLQALLKEFSDVPAENLELEILETAALHDIDQVSSIMKQCEEMGINFALDDFGTGYSSLTYLKRLPAKILKIDRSFILDLLEDPDDIAITEGILGLTQAFHRIPIAEGVETIQHGKLLLSLGCQLAQGYGIARPMPAQDLPGWIDNFVVADEWRDSSVNQLNEEDNSLLIMAVEHHRLVSQVLTAVEQSAPSLLPENLQDEHACTFGHWLDSDGFDKFGEMELFKPMKEKHRLLHEICNLTAKALHQNNKQVLQQNCQQLKEIRGFILDSLNKIRTRDDHLNN